MNSETLVSRDKAVPAQLLAVILLLPLLFYAGFGTASLTTLLIGQPTGAVRQVYWRAAIEGFVFGSAAILLIVIVTGLFRLERWAFIALAAGGALGAVALLIRMFWRLGNDLVVGDPLVDFWQVTLVWIILDIVLVILAVRVLRAPPPSAASGPDSPPSGSSGD